MGTRIVKLTGIAEWAKVFEQNRDLTGWKPTLQAEGSYEKYNGACTIDMILDEDNITKLQAARSSKTPKLDPEGRGMRVKFDRKFDTGYDWSSGAPVVKKADGSAWDFETDGIIGNGSTVETTVAIYDLPKYGNTGTRLESIKVIDHVEYTQDQDSGSPPPTTKKPDAAPVEEAILF
tara:strand:- start:448 stop:978 length:531 start_codon:yes stop_codon:yes gene_type:complete